MASRVPVVLLVDDDPGDILMITEALERSGTPPIIQVAGNGQEALDYLQSTRPPTRTASKSGSRPDAGPDASEVRPDLILLDLNMPRMDGREFLARIKTDPQFRAVPVVVLTTSNAESDVLASYRAHASAFVTKPLNLDALDAVVTQINSFYTTTSTLLPAGHDDQNDGDQNGCDSNPEI